MTKLKLYLYLFTFLAIVGLSTAVYVQHTSLKVKSERLDKIEADYQALSTSITDAQTNLESLRNELSTISQQTTQLRKQVKSIPKPTPTADNTKEIQEQSNALSQSIFGRIK